MAEVLLSVKNVTKDFPGVRALKGVSLDVEKGEVHALVGENGAGKSTLMKCLIGMYRPTSGEIWFENKKCDISGTRDSLNLGISMIHQELSPVLYRPIMENVWLGREPKTKMGLVDHKKMYKMTAELLESIEMTENPKTLMADLTVAKIQMIEIAKAISYNSKLIIMDEPTSSLTEKEVKQLFKIIRQLKERGISIVYISHKMDEIFEITDRTTVFRDGELIGTKKTADFPLDEMISMMVGRSVDNLYYKTGGKIGDVLMEVKNLTGEKFRNVSFTLRRGEILGFAGLVGAGRTELVEALFGIRSKHSGSVYISGEEVHINSPIQAIEKKMALLTEERRQTGIFPMLSVADNMTIAHIKSYLKSSRLLDFSKMKDDCEKYVDEINVKTPSLKQEIQYLSGGNQQKVLVARWLLTSPDILFMDEPTRGIDVGAKAEIYKLIDRLAQLGKAVVMISSELPEILGMSDRILVMHEGHVTAILENDDSVTQEKIISYATGVLDDFPEQA